MKNLNKELTLVDVFCVATGAMISSGLFILPGLAFAKAGPAVIVSYLLAALLCVPTLLSKAELTTAMPKAGGDYFYIMRGFGPLVGTLAGFSSWFSLSFKTAFALLGIGAYLSLVMHLPINVIASWFCLFFILLNVIGVKLAVRFQVIMVLALLGILIGYNAWGLNSVNISHFSPFVSEGFGSVFAAASLVFISYGGLTKVAAVAEEVKNPGRNLPLGMTMSLLVTACIYSLTVYVTIGVLDPEILRTSLTPISDAAGVFGGRILGLIVSVGAFIAFITTANAGIMTASRYPLGMSRDKLLPIRFEKIGPGLKTPYVSILFTGFFILTVILFIRLEVLVKVASSILILLYIFANLTLILFRTSKILSYKPKFKAPLYPYLQIFGIFGGVFLLIEMGTATIFLTTIFLIVAAAWYKVYVQKRASQDSALIHVLERLVAKDKELTSDDLLTELKDIVVQRDGVKEDRFHTLIEDGDVLDMKEPLTMEDFLKKVTDIFGADFDVEPDSLFKKLMKREEESSTVIREGLAIPHIVVRGKDIFRILLVRAKGGIIFPGDKLVHVVFVLVGSADQRNLHLRVLSAIAQITQNPEFDKEWMRAAGKKELKNIVLLADRRRG